jgi:hypothetical protein
MSISKCIVRLKDCHDTEHSVEVYAESLYEAVLRGLGRLQDVGWESDTNETIKRVEVEIHQEPTRHIVDVLKLLKWVQALTYLFGVNHTKIRLSINPHLSERHGIIAVGLQMGEEWRDVNSHRGAFRTLAAL